MSEFSLHIELGDEAMRTATDVSWALAVVMQRLHQGHTEGTITDINGNTVGKWHLALPVSTEGTCTELDMGLRA